MFFVCMFNGVLFGLDVEGDCPTRSFIFALLLPSPYFGPNSLLILLVFGTEYFGVYYRLLHCEIL